MTKDERLNQIHRLVHEAFRRGADWQLHHDESTADADQAAERYAGLLYQSLKKHEVPV